MDKKITEEKYEEMIQKLFHRFPSFQKVGAGAYKPGIANMEFADQLMGHPHRKYKIIHVAGTNGKGSVSNMLASVLASTGQKVGLYTSPHILDFRERMRILQTPGAFASVDGFAGNVPSADSFAENVPSVDSFAENVPSVDSFAGNVPSADSFAEGVSSDETMSVRASGEGVFKLISKQEVWDFVQQWQDTFDHLDMSFFEITTLMAMDWFARQEVDIVVLETGLGGRLDSTNIVTPVLSIITNIGLDHCDMLGETLPEIAFEKAGIIKPTVPVVVGESHEETISVFERKVLYTNLSEPKFMGSRTEIMSLLTFADKTTPSLWECNEEILSRMDLKGEYQRKNLRTVLAALDVLSASGELSYSVCCSPSENGSSFEGCNTIEDKSKVINALIHAAARAGFHGRWEQLLSDPLVICDIGHNEHGLRHNFAQLERMKREGECTELIVVYGSVADKDVDAVLHLMPQDASYIFTQAHGKRALPAEEVLSRFKEHWHQGSAIVVADVTEAVKSALDRAAELKATDPQSKPLIYIGGSTYVVSEAVAFLQK